jgi:hypothetical protein
VSTVVSATLENLRGYSAHTKKGTETPTATSRRFDSGSGSLGSGGFSIISMRTGRKASNAVLAMITRTRWQ